MTKYQTGEIRMKLFRITEVTFYCSVILMLIIMCGIIILSSQGAFQENSQFSGAFNVKFYSTMLFDGLLAVLAILMTLILYVAFWWSGMMQQIDQFSSCEAIVILAQGYRSKLLMKLYDAAASKQFHADGSSKQGLKAVSMKINEQLHFLNNSEKLFDNSELKETLSYLLLNYNITLISILLKTIGNSGDRFFLTSLNQLLIDPSCEPEKDMILECIQKLK